MNTEQKSLEAAKVIEPESSKKVVKGQEWENEITDRNDPNYKTAKKELESFDGTKVEMEYSHAGEFMSTSGKKIGTIRSEYEDFPYYRIKSLMFFDGKKTTKYLPMDVGGDVGIKPLKLKVLKTGLIDRSYPSNYVSLIETKVNEVLSKMDRAEYDSQYMVTVDFEQKVKHLADKVMYGNNQADIDNVRRLMDVYNSSHNNYSIYHAAKTGKYSEMIKSGTKTAEEVISILNRAKVEVPKEIADYPITFW